MLYQHKRIAQLERLIIKLEVEIIFDGDIIWLEAVNQIVAEVNAEVGLGVLNGLLGVKPLDKSPVHDCKFIGRQDDLRPQLFCRLQI